ncbi:ECF transporter S component [Catenisphaera adipataccumulans]|jgi:riboflavin transporter FmnP|uniref:Riboflavin transporter FmnP n=1 Tax=Catenisphaera adipataccumulans TaxID=700500 RepID=A0A7W8CYK1_9FIRM|nr:ECF transporter S component [Catenisphaera adipataccumulans]MBB5182764.1 riboflavin transporter FmnP [Catenisphaera adipataccumulans]
MKENRVKNLALAALFLALCMILPFVTGQIPQIGQALLPMHIPVLLCGLICGKRFGGIVGFIAPLLRFVLFGMPPIYPTGLAMCFELAAYGFLIGWLFEKSSHSLGALYRCLIMAMVGGRIVWGAAEVILLGLGHQAFTWKLFMAGAFINAIPGIVLQLVLIPLLMMTLDKTGVYTLQKKSAA